jgi:hypothetical protein
VDLFLFAILFMPLLAAGGALPPFSFVDFVDPFAAAFGARRQRGKPAASATGGFELLIVSSTPSFLAWPKALRDFRNGWLFGFILRSGLSVDLFS